MRFMNARSIGIVLILFTLYRVPAQSETTKAGLATVNRDDPQAVALVEPADSMETVSQTKTRQCLDAIPAPSGQKAFIEKAQKADHRRTSPARSNGAVQ